MVFVRRFRGYRDPDMTLHAALSLEQVGLGSTVQHGCQLWAQRRAQRLVTPAPSCPGWHGVDVTPISSATPLYRAVVRLTSREWLDALVGCDVLVRGLVARGLGRGGESVPRPRPYGWGLGRVRESVPRPRPYGRGLGRVGESVPRPRPYARGLGRDGESVPHPRPCGAGPRASQKTGTSSEAPWFRSRPSPLWVGLNIVRGGPGGPAEPRIRWGFAGGCLLASIFTRSKRFIRFLLRGPLFMVPDN